MPVYAVVHAIVLRLWVHVHEYSHKLALITFPTKKATGFLQPVTTEGDWL